MDHVPSPFEHDADGAGSTLNAGPAKRWAFVALTLLFVILFSALGVWQVERLAWKRDLIARVDARTHAAPRPAPGPAQWPRLTPGNAEYLKVRARGTYMNDHETLVQALTDFGPGYWVLTPLKTGWGTVLVNRGFVPAELRSRQSRKAGEQRGVVEVTGLLRMTEPAGAFLRRNVPREDRWYSRDVAAIGRSRGLSGLAPYFIDRDAAPVTGGWPRGGLTIVKFRNAHLQYAITWFGLALLSAVATFIVIRRR